MSDYFIGFKDMIKIIKQLCILMLVISQISNSQEFTNPLESNNVSLTIIPHICVAPRGTTSCISRIEVLWESSKKGNFCLNSNLELKKLACWENIDKGTYQHKLIFDQNIIYTMIDAFKEITIAQDTLFFKKMKPHRNYNKRQKRFPWSINTP